MKKILLFLIIFIFTFNSNAQLIEVNKTGITESEYSLQQLVENVLIAGECSEIDSFESEQFGEPRDISTKSYGFFHRRTNTGFPFESGIIITSGSAQPAGNIETLETLNVFNGNLGDSDLETALNVVETYDASFVKFNFKALNNSISFRFLMASEEYDGSTECSFADSFAFLLREVGTTNYINLAVLPNNTPVSTTNINNSFDCGKNVEFFEGYGLRDTNYGGRTKVLTASSAVVLGTTYEIKLVISDQGDDQYDSAVFLEAGSFNLGIDLGEDLTLAQNNAVCGNIKELDASINANSYKWFKDGVVIPGAINRVYQANLGNGIYKVEAILNTSSCTSSGDINLEFATKPIANKPLNIISCDDDLNGFNQFNLNNLKDAEILNVSDPTISEFEVLYFSTLSAATDNVADTDLPNPHQVNTGVGETIYARVQNKIVPNSCFDITSFTIVITGIPVPETPSDYSFCDNTSVGSDTDGFINNFILKEKDKEILGEDLDAAQYSVSYHTSEIGAKTSTTLDVIDKTTNYKNTTTNTQPIYVRVENVDNNTCFDASKTFKLIVNPLPVIASSELEYCLSKNNTNPTINLTLAAQNISNNYLNELFIYYEDELGIDEITNSTEYPVITNTRKSVYVKVFNKVTLCSRAVVELVLNIATEDDNSYDALQTPVCDDFTGVDASDTDKITNFYLNKAAIINSINPPANTNVFFYESINNRANSLDEIDITEYRNKELGTRNDTTIVTNGIQFPIYYKILSEINNNCQGLGQFYVQINTAPAANPVASLELCDSANDGDGANGIAQSFNLESQTLSILGAQNTTDYTVTYHLSKTGANAGNNPQASPFTNTTRDLQTIYIRVTDNNTNCFTDQTSFDLVVTPLPFANFVEDLEICDDNSDGSARNGFSKTIDLESQTGLILGTQDPTVYSITYHHTLLEAQNGSNPLVTPYSNTIPYEETIFVRIYNSVTMCNNSNSNFNVIVNPEPIVTAVSNLSYCDDDADGDDENQIIQNIDLESLNTQLLGNSQDPDDYNISFHISKTDASSGNLPIASPYTNTNPVETIFVRVQNKDTSCVNDDVTFDIIVNSLPEFNVNATQILCLNDTPKNIFVEEPAAIYSYIWNDASGNMLSIEKNLDIAIGGSYSVTATTTNGTNCSRTKTIVVTESNPANLLPSYITIVDQANAIGSEDNLSIVIDVLNNNLGPGDYQFALRNDDQNTTTQYQDNPLFENLEGGIYTIIVNDKNGCIPDATLQVSVLQFPEFFTPNGDNKNDTWVIKGANKTFYPNSSINIFNRYGKIVAQIPIDENGWDGNYNSKKMPSDDYWYNITLIPADTNKPTINKIGNFSLLRK